MKTIGWEDLDGLVDALRQAHPRVDPRALDDSELQGLIAGLEGAGPGIGEGRAGDYEALRAMWHWGA